MDRSTGRLLIIVLLLIAALLAVIIVLLLQDDPSPSASPAEAVTTTVPAPPSATTGTTADTTFVLTPSGLGAVTIGSDPADLAAAGLITYAGPDFTPEVEGYLCGFADSAGVYGPDSFSGQMMERGLVRLYIIDSRIRTPEGIGVGSDEAQMVAALGPPTEAYANVFNEFQTHHLYRRGDLGLMFTTEAGVVVQANAGYYDMLGASEGCV